ncbi:MAG: hypothetical protein BVN31_07820 [Proteobacteria bacterium ST_bin15]|nr:MAG: hypothetical protein BVN31_07820 [Proteobacteria bacterium ST_bin15]
MSELHGIVFKIAATFVFVVMAMMVKLVAARLPTGEIVFARSLFAVIPILVYIAMRGPVRTALATRRPFAHALRVCIGISSMALGFAGLSYIPLPDATAIGYAMPIFGVIFAATILHERVRIYRWTAVGIGMVGVLIILWPHLGEALTTSPSAAAIGALLCLVAAVCSAFAMVTVRALTSTEEPPTIAFYFSLGGAAIGLATALFGWVMPTPGEAALLLAIGVSGGVGQLLLTTSFKYADASLIAPFEYTSIAWAVMLGWFVFGDVPGTQTIIGGLVVILSGMFVIFRERQLGLKAKYEAAARMPR